MPARKTRRSILLPSEGSHSPARRQGAALREEFATFDYRRAFIVPAGIDADRVTADLKQGVLWLHLPKSSALKPRQIAVKAG